MQNIDLNLIGELVVITVQVGEHRTDVHTGVLEGSTHVQRRQDRPWDADEQGLTPGETYVAGESLAIFLGGRRIDIPSTVTYAIVGVRQQ